MAVACFLLAAASASALASLASFAAVSFLLVSAIKFLNELYGQTKSRWSRNRLERARKRLYERNFEVASGLGCAAGQQFLRPYDSTVAARTCATSGSTQGNAKMSHILRGRGSPRRLFLASQTRQERQSRFATASDHRSSHRAAPATSTWSLYKHDV